ncbi:hypothetical protein PACTADRAFT_5160 [Pachysolen tannophilus NRRL Y-2460]|uniref:glucan endo-1,3-beta-D-glucosidase n=1 Tax=Pachysolen tannophilus NRRL Y-2460 TaxID=669874 RepID=A0A1E4TNN5_PACTA|nr:hypothetical protein PACTADRAFT_5160 [Pachysolen tannophilus NRRL Y-2460]
MLPKNIAVLGTILFAIQTYAFMATVKMANINARQQTAVANGVADANTQVTATTATTTTNNNNNNQQSTTTTSANNNNNNDNEQSSSTSTSANNNNNNNNNNGQSTSTTSANNNNNNNNNQQSTTTTAAAAGDSANDVTSSSSSSYPTVLYSAIEFENLGYSGGYYAVKELSDVDTDSCSCTLDSDTTAFSGVNAPLNEELSVHFRGPLVLKKFAYYVSEDWAYNNDSATSDWSRLAYYDSSSSTAENVTFLTAAGNDSSCLGYALTYAGKDGVSAASESTVLEDDALIISDEEFIIYSNISCDDSGYDNDCGVYRSGTPAYHGYYGSVKMFLFEFTMPNEDTAPENTTDYNLPAIWLLNARIPRTSEYPTSTNCSCWDSGCGEFDIFEVLNATYSDNLYTTIHDYQGTSDIDDGIRANGYLKRYTDATMKGGVVFDSNGSAIVFMNNDTEIESTISSSDLNSWIEDAGSMVEDTLDTVESTSTSSSSSPGTMNSVIKKSINESMTQEESHSEASFAETYQQLNEAEAAASKLENLLDSIEAKMDSILAEAGESKVEKNEKGEAEEAAEKEK